MEVHSEPLRPERITKPIQLLGAWLAGLLAINSSFLIAAVNIGDGHWERGALVIASIVNVPLFLLAVFVLQTRFRPELQEDSYYSTYLNSKTDEPVRVSKLDAHFAELRQQIAELEYKAESRVSSGGEGDDSESVLPNLTFGINSHLIDRVELQHQLKEKDVLAITSFGAENPPKKRNVSISQYLPRRYVRQVLALAREMDFESFNFFDNHAEDAEEDVLLGSYGKAEFEL